MDKKQIKFVLDDCAEKFEQLAQNVDDIQLLRFKYKVYRYVYNQLMSEHGDRIETDNELLDSLKRYENAFVRADDILFTHGY